MQFPHGIKPTSSLSAAPDVRILWWKPLIILAQLPLPDVPQNVMYSTAVHSAPSCKPLTGLGWLPGHACVCESLVTVLCVMWPTGVSCDPLVCHVTHWCVPLVCHVIHWCVMWPTGVSHWCVMWSTGVSCDPLVCPTGVSCDPLVCRDPLVTVNMDPLSWLFVYTLTLVIILLLELELCILQAYVAANDVCVTCVGGKIGSLCTHLHCDWWLYLVTYISGYQSVLFNLGNC